MKRVLILCTGNSCRSQMAEVIWRKLGGDRWQVDSAGSRPAGYVHPNALAALAEIGLPVDNLSSKSLEPFLGQPIDLVVTVCGNADQACPTFPGAQQRLHWPFPDPADASGSEAEIMETFRNVRDAIQHQVQSFLDNE